MKPSKDLSFLSIVAVVLALLSLSLSVKHCGQRSLQIGDIVLGNADSAGSERTILFDTSMHYWLQIELDTLPLDSATLYGTNWDSVVIEIHKGWLNEISPPIVTPVLKEEDPVGTYFVRIPKNHLPTIHHAIWKQGAISCINAINEMGFLDESNEHRYYTIDSLKVVPLLLKYSE